MSSLCSSLLLHTYECSHVHLSTVRSSARHISTRLRTCCRSYYKKLFASESIMETLFSEYGSCTTPGSGARRSKSLFCSIIEVLKKCCHIIYFILIRDKVNSTHSSHSTPPRARRSSLLPHRSYPSSNMQALYRLRELNNDCEPPLTQICHCKISVTWGNLFTSS